MADNAATRDRPGKTTDDDPIEVAEKKTQKRGTFLLCLGIVLIVAITVIPTRLVVYSPGHLDDPVRLTGTILNVVTVLGAGFVLIGCGIGEKMRRAERANVRRASKIAPENAERIDLLVKTNTELQEMVHALAERVLALSEQLDEQKTLVEKLPKFAEGMEMGVRLRREFLPPDA